MPRERWAANFASESRKLRSTDEQNANDIYLKTPWVVYHKNLNIPDRVIKSIIRVRLKTFTSNLPDVFSRTT